MDNVPKETHVVSVSLDIQDSGNRGQGQRQKGTIVFWRKNNYKLKNSDKTRFYVPGEVKAVPAPTSKRPEEREFVVDSGESMDMMSKQE